MSARAHTILSRFPTHYEAARSGKQFEAVVGAVAGGLDVYAAALARVRRAHRLADADELSDLLLIAARHGITRAELEVLLLRWRRAAALLMQALAGAGTPAARDEAAEELIALWGVAAPPPRLPLYAPTPAGGGGPDADATRARVTQHVGLALRRGRLTNAVRQRVVTIASIHAHGNGTVRSVLGGAANALDLDIGTIHTSADRFWHAATAHDRIALTRPIAIAAGPQGPAREAAMTFDAAEEIIGLEENPLERVAAEPVARHHGELFSILRRGFDRVLMQVRVTGKENRSVGPMVVNRDEGHAIGYARPIPSTQTLTFTEEGRALLDGTDVTAFAYAWTGACFAGADARPTDFVFDGPGVDPGRGAVFAVATPAGALDPAFTFPHGGESLPVPSVAVGETRLAFFVQQGFFSSDASDASGQLLVTPRPAVAFADNSVTAAGPDETPADAALVALSWLEHRAFCARVLVPRRFRDLVVDDPDGVEVRQRVRQALDRFRPAGVELRVDFVDDRWVLGQGALAEAAGEDPVSQIQGGTLLWAPPPGS